MKANTILETIGGTAAVRIQRLFPNSEVWISPSGRNPRGSIKDRIALAMSRGGGRRARSSPAARSIEPTSGNTGIGLALVRGEGL